MTDKMRHCDTCGRDYEDAPRDAFTRHLEGLPEKLFPEGWR